MTVLFDLRSDVLLPFTLSYFICILLPLLFSIVSCPFLWNSSDPKRNLSFYAFIMTNKALLYFALQFLAL